MALQTSGQITLNDIHIEAGGGSGTQASINDSDIRGLIGKASGAQMAFSEWYGASASVWDTASAVADWGGGRCGFGTSYSTYSTNASTWYIAARIQPSTNSWFTTEYRLLDNVNLGISNGATVEVEYDLTVTAPSYRGIGTVYFIGNHVLPSGGISTADVGASGTQTYGTTTLMVQAYDYQNQVTWRTGTTNNTAYLSGGTVRKSGTFTFTANSFNSYPGIMFKSQAFSTNGTGWGSVTVHKLLIKSVT